MRLMAESPPPHCGGRWRTCHRHCRRQRKSRCRRNQSKDRWRSRRSRSGPHECCPPSRWVAAANGRAVAVVPGLVAAAPSSVASSPPSLRLPRGHCCSPQHMACCSRLGRGEALGASLIAKTDIRWCWHHGHDHRCWHPGAWRRWHRPESEPGRRGDSVTVPMRRAPGSSCHCDASAPASTASASSASPLRCCQGGCRGHRTRTHLRCRYLAKGFEAVQPDPWGFQHLRNEDWSLSQAGNASARRSRSQDETAELPLAPGQSPGSR
mmetsp:Transcript_81225/g.164520  ORF Transcript_81225/g.164520 Transcript_81225/m.164520 type:complete len:266 (-) Transcript_81225:257-1054(-)